MEVDRKSEIMWRTPNAACYLDDVVVFNPDPAAHVLST